VAVVGTNEAVEEAEALHARVRRVIAGASHEPFDAIARDLAVFQAKHVDGYARLCAAHGVDPSRDPIERLPAVPTDAFRVARVASFPESFEVARFQTSGTTVGLAARGVHAMRTLETYHDASLAWAGATLFDAYEGDALWPVILALSPSPSDTRDSSLVRMLGWFVDEIGAKGSRFVAPDDAHAARRAIVEAASIGRPLVIAATAFAWVYLVDALGEDSLALPACSRAMQTGGFKGRTRELSASELRASIARGLGIDRRDVVGEYGMTELTSQLWAVGGDGERWIYRAPPWARVRACDPATLAPLPVGVRGIARIEDLGNVESAWAVQTADEVIVGDDGGVELLGRAKGAPPRGCSLAVEEILASRDR
jgi:hypothetical protein